MTAAAGRQAGLAALDVDEFLGAEIGAEPGLGHHVVGELERGGGGDHGVAAVRDIGERSAMDERRIVLERLHQIGRQRILEQRRHRAVGLQIAGADRLLLAGVADDDLAQPLFQILEAGGQAEDRHDLGGHDDVEAVLARIAVGRGRRGRR